MLKKSINWIKARLPLFWVGDVMCRFGFHDWEISKWCRFKDRTCKYLLEEGFNRTCQRCDKKQTLKRPEKYHPSKYVWTDSNGI
jgi:uncharacterized protein CbrC (UPF0167 family)